MRVTFLDFFLLEKSSTFVWFLWHFPKSRFFLSKKNSQSSTNLSRRLLNLIRKKAFVILMKSFHSLHFIAVWFFKNHFCICSLKCILSKPTTVPGVIIKANSIYHRVLISFSSSVICHVLLFNLQCFPHQFFLSLLETFYLKSWKQPTMFSLKLQPTRRSVKFCPKYVLSFFKYVRKISPLGSFTLNRYKWYWDHLRQMRENCL